MTYYELWQDAIKKLDNDEITLGEYEEMIAPLHREVDALDKIRAEIEEQIIPRSSYTDKQKRQVLEIIDKYKAESEDEE